MGVVVRGADLVPPGAIPAVDAVCGNDRCSRAQDVRCHEQTCDAQKTRSHCDELLETPTPSLGQVAARAHLSACGMSIGQPEDQAWATLGLKEPEPAQT